MAGYSKRPLAAKLGIKNSARVYFGNAPRGYVAALKLKDVRLAKTLTGELDFIQVFIDRSEDLAARIARCKKHLAKDGALWVSWIKKSSPRHTGMTDITVREQGLLAGLVDVKVCAVDEDWSGIKFVYRLKDR